MLQFWNDSLNIEVETDEKQLRLPGSGILWPKCDRLIIQRSSYFRRLTPTSGLCKGPAWASHDDS
jgi:hypothetical protein